MFRPVEPRPLQRYKPNGFPWSSQDVIPITLGKPLFVQLPPETRGDILEISSDSDDEYDITFYQKWMENNLLPLSETLRVPRASGKGLQIRYLQIPGSIVARSFSSLQIEPKPGGENFRVGHLFIYSDPYREKKDRSLKAEIK